MRFAWDETKRRDNLRTHGFDFAGAATVFDSDTYTFEDDRFQYGEQRFVTLGILDGVPVTIVHTEVDHEIRVISFREATAREAIIYFTSIAD